MHKTDSFRPFPYQKLVNYVNVRQPFEWFKPRLRLSSLGVVANVSFMIIRIEAASPYISTVSARATGKFRMSRCVIDLLKYLEREVAGISRFLRRELEDSKEMVVASAFPSS